MDYARSVILVPIWNRTLTVLLKLMQMSTEIEPLIELLIEKWYIARHDEELLYAEICDISDEKARPKKAGYRIMLLSEDEQVSQAYKNGPLGSVPVDWEKHLFLNCL